MMKQAMFFNALPEKKVQCILCPNYCWLDEGDIGRCRGRGNTNGTMMLLNYGKVAAINIDPIEKKPLYHYYPGSQVLSLGANSCNLACNFCQNFEISQRQCQTSSMAPEELVQKALQHRLNLVAFTYTEPFTWYEYIYDCSPKLKERDIKTILVTNGYVNYEPLMQIIPYIDAMNIDLKSMQNSFYKEICCGNLDPVLRTIEIAAKHSHIEITNLVIPELNDNRNYINQLIDFISGINPDIPVHFSKYFPKYHSKQQETDNSLLLDIYNIARQKLSYVYLGNIAFHNHTYCPNCGMLLIKRSPLSVQRLAIKDSSCDNCGYSIYGDF